MLLLPKRLVHVFLPSFFALISFLPSLPNNPICIQISLHQKSYIKLFNTKHVHDVRENLNARFADHIGHVKTSSLLYWLSILRFVILLSFFCFCVRRQINLKINDQLFDHDLTWSLSFIKNVTCSSKYLFFKN